MMKTKDGLLALRSSELDRATTDSEAYDRAKPLMDQVKGALAISHGAGVSDLRPSRKSLTTAPVDGISLRSFAQTTRGTGPA